MEGVREGGKNEGREGGILHVYMYNVHACPFTTDPFSRQRSTLIRIPQRAFLNGGLFIVN